MSIEKPEKALKKQPIEPEFFVGVPPPDTTPTEAVSEPPLPAAADDPSAILKQFVAGLPKGGEIAEAAERARHNAHITAERLIKLEKRKQRREKRGRT